MIWKESDGVRRLEAELDGGARAAFTTRHGGVSEGPYRALNLGVLTADRSDRVLENRRRLAAALGIDPAAVVMGHQVHGAEIHRPAERPEPSPFTAGVPAAPGDGQVSADRSLVPLVLVADCLPIALSGPGGIAALHGGWRGLAAGIVERGVAAVEAGCAAIGPGIGPCCFEVGPEVLAEFTHLGEGIAEGRMLDLPEVAERLLRAAGVRRIERSDLCSYCEPELFFSHRRDGGVTGRQAGLVFACPS